MYGTSRCGKKRFIILVQLRPGRVHGPSEAAEDRVPERYHRVHFAGND